MCVDGHGFNGKRGRSRWSCRLLDILPLILATLCCGGLARVAYAAVNVWSSSGLQGLSITSLAIDPATPSTLYAGTSDQFGSGSVFKSIDSGGSWSSSLKAGAVQTLAIHPPALYAAVSIFVYKSTDGGLSWTDSGTGLSGYTVNALAIDPGTPGTLYVGLSGDDSGVFKSSDGGMIFNLSLGLANTGFTAVVIDPRTPSTLYAGTEQSGVFKSTDGGANWSPSSTGLNNRHVHALVINPLQPATLYAGTDNQDEFGQGGVYKSTDAGASWSAMNSGLPIDGSPPGIFVRALAIDQRMPTTLYVATAQDGVFQSTDGGASWHAFNAGLPDLFSVFTLAIAARGPRTLYAGASAGVFAIETATFTVNSTADAVDALPGDTLCATAAGDCTLRAAIDEGNALPGGSTIVVPAGTYRGGFGFNVSLTVLGAGAARTRIDGGFSVTSGATIDISGMTLHGPMSSDTGISNNGNLRLTNVTITGFTRLATGSGAALGGGMFNSGTATLTNVTVSGNTAHTEHGNPGWGGGIFNSGTLGLANCTISGNTAAGNFRTGRGGGIFSSGNAALTNVTISGNSADDLGGGLFNDGPAGMTITATTVSGNMANQGGGMYNFGGASLTNVTISDNMAAEIGGGIISAGNVTLTNVTVSGNSAEGIHGIGGGAPLRLKNTLATNNGGENCAGSIFSFDHSLCGDDPYIGPLQDNGGPTLTHALLLGSPAIDTGSPDCPPPDTDQRGVTRSPPCDIGAYEFTAAGCLGDCSQDGHLTADEVLTMMNIALGNADVSTCAAGVPTSTVTVAQIIAAVSNVSTGCAHTPATPTATPTTPTPTPPPEEACAGKPDGTTCDAGTDSPHTMNCANGTCAQCAADASASPRFVDNDDGTITDRQTCLVWEKKDSAGGIHDLHNLYVWSVTGGTPAPKDVPPFAVFLDELQSAGFAGHQDWRLPTSAGGDGVLTGQAAEIESIADMSAPGCGRGAPCLAAIFSTNCGVNDDGNAGCTVNGTRGTQACSCTASGFYWSSTADPGNTSLAWFLGSTSGYTGRGYRTNSGYVRAVRGGV